MILGSSTIKICHAANICPKKLLLMGALMMVET